MNKTYKIANYNKEGIVSNKLRNSFLLEDIGIRNKDFLSTITLSTILALGTMISLYYLWRI